MKITEGFPDLVKQFFPKISTPMPGFTGNLLQGEECQLVFSEFNEDFHAPDHAHKPHWGLILQGEATMTINGETKTYGPGEYYIVPDGAVHSARIKKGTRSIDIWFQKDYLKQPRG
jgi:quercetin dioxygenase-like cupin family protein